MSDIAVMHEEEAPPVITGEHNDGEITDLVMDITLRPINWGFLVSVFALAGVTTMMVTAIGYLLIWGIGVWGVNVPVAWGLAIINFVWWIGIGHAGTLISAILLLLRQEWRTSINRFAEAMTLFAVANAGMFPLLHLGRPIIFYYLLPYPNRMSVWPQWRSSLVWDVFAVATYFTVSVLFWYAGLMPDLASLRDKARPKWVRYTAGICALGWRGSARQWRRHKEAYLILAGLATPLVVSVHSIVSMDFAEGIVPGWHETIFPPYFVAGAIYSGFAMVITLTVPLRWMFNLYHVITERHMEAMAKVMLATGLIVAYGYMSEMFMAFYSGDAAEIARAMSRVSGPTAPVFWATIACNVVCAQALWFRWVRRHTGALYTVTMAVNLGMWLERYDIVAGSLRQGFPPSRWGYYVPTLIDWAVLLGTLGFFALLFVLFVRLCPIMSSSEIKELWHKQRKEKQARIQRLTSAGGRVLPRNGMLMTDSGKGAVAEFDEQEKLVLATAGLRRAWYLHLEAYGPTPVEGLDDVLGLGKTRIPLIMLIGAVIGASGGFFMQWYAAVIDFPWNVGGRPFFSWPSFIPLTFELAVLCSSLAGFFGMLYLNKLPQYYHPVSEVPGFERASRDRYFLWVDRKDPLYDAPELKRQLGALGALRVCETEEHVPEAVA